MSAPARLELGDKIGPLVRGPITTRQLVEYAGASLDFNRIHYDEPFARAGGHPSVIAHGMLSMAFMGQLVAELAGGPLRIRSLKARFKAVTYPGDTIRVTGEVVAVDPETGTVELTLAASRDDGTVAVQGEATIAG